MSQITIYLPAELEQKMKASAKAMNLSQSKWIANLIEEKLHNEWPPAVVALAGAWNNMPLAEEIRADIGTDSLREAL